MAFNGLVVKGDLCFGFQLPEHGHLKFNKGMCSRKSEELLVNISDSGSRGTVMRKFMMHVETF